MACPLNSCSLLILSLSKDNRMLQQHVLFSHHNLFLSRSRAVNEKAIICIEWLQNIVSVSD